MQYNQGYKVSNGFDTNSCHVSGNPSSNSVQTCCGSYPNRYLFNNQLGMRGCCGDVVFDVTQMTCCPNDVLVFGPCGNGNCC